MDKIRIPNIQLKACKRAKSMHTVGSLLYFPTIGESKWKKMKNYATS